MEEGKNKLGLPLIVSGPPRAGTSLLAGILYLCGAWKGDTVEGNKDNPKGYFENLRIRDEVVKPLLKLLGGDKMGQKAPPWPIPPNKIDELALRLRKKLLDILNEQGYPGQIPWVYKDSKLSLIAPLFMKAFPEAFFFITRREPEAIAASFLKTLFNRVPDYQSALELANTYVERSEMFHPKHIVYTQNLVLRKEKGTEWFCLRDVIKDIPGLTWNEHVILEFVEPSLWHH